jgi:glycerol kinase
VTDLQPLLLAVDQGTSATKALLLSPDGSVVHSASVPVRISHPRPGWVEQDADDIMRSVHEAINACLAAAPGPVAAVGLSSQRESAMLWDRRTGRPLGPVLGWQDRRTQPRAAELGRGDGAEVVRRVSGLPIDPMFSALKLRWLLDDLGDGAPSVADVAAGTIDAWIVYCLTGEHRIEAGNASRTQLLDVRSARWSPELIDLFGIPETVLPRIAGSIEPTAAITGVDGLNGIPVSGVLADSHAALFAHGIRKAGQVKATYGTGSSVMGLLADGADTGEGLVHTIAWQLDRPIAAFEGNVLSAGATVVWLAEILGLTPGEVFGLAEKAPPDHGVALVPAFSGLGAPWWDDQATAVLTGFGPQTSREDLARAAVESIALQVESVLEAADLTGERVDTVLVDGGPTSNDWLLQLQADISGRRITRSAVAELSASGAAQAAALGAGLLTEDDLQAIGRRRTTFTPDATAADTVARDRASHWQRSVRAARALKEPHRPL